MKIDIPGALLKMDLPRVFFILSLTALLAGCGANTKQEVLSFLFDGVPPVGGLESEGASATAGEAEIPDTDGPENVTEITQMVQHPPFAEGMCDNCHQVPERTGGVPMGFGLLEEREKLCLMCHDDMSQENLAETYAWVHGPVQYGACVICHHPHESPMPYMLRADPVRKLCFRCHDEDRILKSEMHEEIGELDCTECHDPHGGPERYYLKM